MHQLKIEQCLHSTLKIFLGSKVSLYKKLMVLDSDLLDQENPVCILFYYEWPQPFSLGRPIFINLDHPYQTNLQKQHGRMFFQAEMALV